MRKIFLTILPVLALVGCHEELGNPDPTPNDTIVSYANQIQPIFDQDCIRCHSGRRIEGGLDLSSYELLRRGGVSGDPVVPGQPDSSLLIQSVDGTKLNHAAYFRYYEGDSGLVLLRRWVAQGALNN